MTGSDDPRGWHDPAAAGQDPAAGPSEPPPVFWPTFSPNSPPGQPTGSSPGADTWAGRPGSGGYETVQFGPTLPPAFPQPKRRRVVIAASAVAAAAVVAAAVVVAMLVIPGGGKKQQPPGPLTPAQVLAASARKSAVVSSLSATYDEQLAGMTVSASVTMTRNPVRMSMKMTMSQNGHSIPFSAMIIGSTVYIKISGVPGEPAALTSKWLEVSLANAGGGTSLGSLLQSLSEENPAYQAQMLRAASNLRADGTQSVAGVSTTRYTGTINPAKADKYLPANVQKALAPGLKEITGNISFTVWIDQSHQLKKMVEHATALGQPLTISYTILSFNQPVTITAPPSSQVVQVPASALQNSGL